jgi:hypothetical protein
MPITHAKVSGKSDGGDATLVLPSDWNASHTVTQCLAERTATFSISSNPIAIPFTATDVYDPDGLHFTSTAALTGTVSKTASSPNITGSGTSFTTELTVNQVISIPGTATEFGVVKTITDNTNLVLWANMANTASGQTATRRAEPIAIPLGKGGGLWTIFGQTEYSGSGAYRLIIRLNGTTSIAESALTVTSSATNQVQGLYLLADGDYIELLFQNQTSGTTIVTDVKTLFGVRG